MSFSIVFTTLSTIIALAGCIGAEPMWEQATAVIAEMAGEETATGSTRIALDESVQLYIIELCKEKHISPALVMAMIERESRCNIDIIGDNGNSLGLMQIQPKWHQERMDRLGCTDLLNPYQNVTVGIDILLELYSKNEDTAWVLMAYNGGIAYADRHYDAGNISEYAEGIMARAEELEQMKGE